MVAAAPSAITHPLRRPPGPKGHFLLGNLAAVSRDWLGFYSRCAKEYGDVVQLRYLHVPICLLMHPRDIEYVLVTNPGNFTKSADYRALARVLGNGLLTNEGKPWQRQRDRKSTRLNSSHGYISYAVFCLKKKKQDVT